MEQREPIAKTKQLWYSTVQHVFRSVFRLETALADAEIPVQNQTTGTNQSSSSRDPTTYYIRPGSQNDGSASTARPNTGTHHATAVRGGVTREADLFRQI